MTVEFVCDDCRASVCAIGREKAPEPPLCAQCAWLREFVPDEAERQQVRDRLG